MLILTAKITVAAMHKQEGEKGGYIHRFHVQCMYNIYILYFSYYVVLMYTEL